MTILIIEYYIIYVTPQSQFKIEKNLFLGQSLFDQRELNYLVLSGLTYEKFDSSAKKNMKQTITNHYVMLDIQNSNFGLLANHWKSCQGRKVTVTFYG